VAATLEDYVFRDAKVAARCPARNLACYFRSYSVLYSGSRSCGSWASCSPHLADYYTDHRGGSVLLIHARQRDEAGTGIEPVNSGFADRGLTTWLPRRIRSFKAITPAIRLSNLVPSPIYRNVAKSRPRSGANGAVSVPSETEPSIIAATDGKSTGSKDAFGEWGFRRYDSIARSVLEPSLSTGYDDAMSRLVWLFHILLVSLGLLTGCSMLSRNYNRIRAELTKPETDEATHNYGAYFEAPVSGPFRKSDPLRTKKTGWKPILHCVPDGRATYQGLARLSVEPR
jgi:hypothetical protein